MMHTTPIFHKQLESWMDVGCLSMETTHPVLHELDSNPLKQRRLSKFQTVQVTTVHRSLLKTPNMLLQEHVFLFPYHRKICLLMSIKETLKEHLPSLV